MGRLAVAVLVLGVSLGAAGAIAKRALLDTAPVPERSRHTIDAGRLRELARRVPGALPRRVNVEVVAETTSWRSFVMAGWGLRPHSMLVTAFQVVYDGRTVVIDAALDRELHERSAPEAPFYQARYRAVQEALRRAGDVVLTCERFDHIGGVSRSPHLDEILPRLRLTREQAASRGLLSRSDFPLERLAEVELLDYAGYYALAPGLVLVELPGYTPGTQLVYALLRDGSELLFVGGVVWSLENVRELTGRPRLVSDWILGEDREAVLDQIRMLHDLKRREPDLHFIVSKDPVALRRHIRAGRIGARFE